MGYFTSFTVFLALNSGQFCDTYLRVWAPSLLGAPGQQLPLVTLPRWGQGVQCTRGMGVPFNEV